MGKLLLTAWIFLASLFGANHQLPAKYTPLATTSPATQPTMSTLTPTATLAPEQIKATYTFYIQATPHKTSRKGLGLKPSDAGTFISLDFGSGKFRVSLSSPQDIFKCVGSECLPHSSPRNAITSFWISHVGFGTITVYEEK